MELGTTGGGIKAFTQGKAHEKGIEGKRTPGSTGEKDILKS